MKRIDDRTVEFTEQEVEVKNLFDDMTDEGMTVTDAAAAVLTSLPDPDPAFVLYLSDGTLAKVHGRVMRVKHLTDSNHPLTGDL